MHTGPAWELAGGVLGQCIGPKHIEFRQLLSTVRAIPEKVWSVQLSFIISDFSMDPEQDLLVVAEWKGLNTCVTAVNADYDEFVD